mmetsp:Transcript_25174/g.44667  ORF Transcript_25174/g.44667 Transcript_25174/m.44667 type:complete len:101 (-) Transcript_25174:98-400(-)
MLLTKTGSWVIQGIEKKRSIPDQRKNLPYFYHRESLSSKPGMRTTMTIAKTPLCCNAIVKNNGNATCWDLLNREVVSQCKQAHLTPSITSDKVLFSGKKK